MPLVAQVSSWSEALKFEFERLYMRRLGAFLALEARLGRTMCPRQDEIFAAFNACPLNKVKVVIIGKEPYCKLTQAEGLSFSIRSGGEVSSSWKAIIREIGANTSEHTTLLSWVEQGVLLLNAVLSVREGKPQSHSNQGWEQFIDAVIRTINRLTSRTVFLFWGAPYEMSKVLINGARHLVLLCDDPTSSEFHGCKCFTATNAYLLKNGKTPIQWTIK
ncbi:uracil-DNA glucosyllase [Thraustotheca clavata]|uniref:Uracil-DNA glucosyllase n=1 Tax=Thraustotheca clavata TaxID=74557 RepID=A0A1W0AAZ9_9STRA|nr:uracil-DNA glucosyllase [Thraustotheca clavata]